MSRLSRDRKRSTRINSLISFLQRLGDGYSPAHIAIDNEDFACLEMCLACGADSEVKSFAGDTPQQLAHLSGLQEMVSCIH